MSKYDKPFYKGGFNGVPNWYHDNFGQKAKGATTAIFGLLLRYEWGSQGFARIMVSKIARELNCSPRTVFRGLAQLKEFAVIKVDHDIGSKGQRPSKFHFTLPKNVKFAGGDTSGIPKKTKKPSGTPKKLKQNQVQGKETVEFAGGDIGVTPYKTKKTTQNIKDKQKAVTFDKGELSEEVVAILTRNDFKEHSWHLVKDCTQAFLLECEKEVEKVKEYKKGRGAMFWWYVENASIWQSDRSCRVEQLALCDNVRAKRNALERKGDGQVFELITTRGGSSLIYLDGGGMEVSISYDEAITTFNFTRRTANQLSQEQQKRLPRKKNRDEISKMPIGNFYKDMAQRYGG